MVIFDPNEAQSLALEFWRGPHSELEAQYLCFGSKLRAEMARAKIDVMPWPINTEIEEIDRFFYVKLERRGAVRQEARL